MCSACTGIKIHRIKNFDCWRQRLRVSSWEWAALNWAGEKTSTSQSLQSLLYVFTAGRRCECRPRPLGRPGLATPTPRSTLPRSISSERRRTPSAFLLHLIILSGNMETNPGPTYPCPACRRPYHRRMGAATGKACLLPYNITQSPPLSPRVPPFAGGQTERLCIVCPPANDAESTPLLCITIWCIRQE